MKAHEPGTASAGRVRPLAGLVKAGDLLIILDRSPGGARRRTLGPVPPLQVAQDPFNHGAVADQADDLKGAGAAGADPRVRFVHFLDQPGPRAPAAARELGAAVGIVLAQRLYSGCGSASRNPE